MSSRLPRFRHRFVTKQAAKEWAVAHVPTGIVPTIIRRPQAGRGGRDRKPWLLEYREPLGAGPAPVNRRVTVAEYGPAWLAKQAPPVLKPRAYEAHEGPMRRHIVPDLGHRRVAELGREELELWLAEKLRTGRAVPAGTPPAGLKRRSVRLIFSTLRAMLNRAVEHRVRPDNPAARLGKRLRLEPTRRERQARVEQRVRSAAEVAAILNACRQVAAGWYPLMLTYATAGVRLGEGVALELADVDWHGNMLRLERALAKNGRDVEEPKHGPRKVDMTPELRAVLALHVAALKRAALKAGTPLGPYLFATRSGTRLGPRNVARKVTALGEKAGVARALGPHDLRHSYARMLLDAGVSPVYVRDQLGHADIALTVNTYGEGATGRGLGKRGELERRIADAADEGFGPVAVIDALLAQSGHTGGTRAPARRRRAS